MEWSSQKTSIKGGLLKKWGLGKKERVVFFRGVDTPMRAMTRQLHICCYLECFTKFFRIQC